MSYEPEITGAVYWAVLTTTPDAVEQYMYRHTTIVDTIETDGGRTLVTLRTQMSASDDPTFVNTVPISMLSQELARLVKPLAERLATGGHYARYDANGVVLADRDPTRAQLLAMGIEDA